MGIIVLSVWSPLGYEVICTEARWEHIQSRHDAELTLENVHDALNRPDAIYEHSEEPKKEIYVRGFVDPVDSELVYTHASVFAPTEDDPVATVITSWTGYSISSEIGKEKWKKVK